MGAWRDDVVPRVVPAKAGTHTARSLDKGTLADAVPQNDGL
jgi:hypothetical protein